MMASEGKKHLNKERDTVCLSLDGLRRIARLFCTLGAFSIDTCRDFYPTVFWSYFYINTFPSKGGYISFAEWRLDKENLFLVLPFCCIGIQTGCETVLLQLANASCGEEKVPNHIPKWKAAHVKNKMKLHAAHVLTMDALLAVGLELGSHAPKCWKHVFRYIPAYIVNIALWHELVYTAKIAHSRVTKTRIIEQYCTYTV